MGCQAACGSRRAYDEGPKDPDTDYVGLLFVWEPRLSFWALGKQPLSGHWRPSYRSSRVGPRTGYFNMVWYCVIWYGMAEYGMIWYSMA